MMKLNYPLFDGEEIWEGATVTVEDGIISSVQKCDLSECGDGFLMPGFVDAHVHIETIPQIDTMIRSGITAACDVSAPRSLIGLSKRLDIISSAGMAMGITINPKVYVEKAIMHGARYIKVILFNTISIGKPALRGIVKAAHKVGMKVAVHAVEIATIKQAVSAGADILIHVPIREPFPVELAKTIAEKDITVIPTLVMMETFARNEGNNDQSIDYQNAKCAVKLLHDCGVTILAGTDANSGAYAPAVGYGHTLHREMELLVDAGLTPTEALSAASSRIADTFIFQAGRIVCEAPATMLLVDGRPDRQITDSKKIRKVWVRGEIMR